MAPDDGVAALHVRALTIEDAVQIAGWRYDGPWDVYDVMDSSVIIEEIGDYSAIADSDDILQGFFCVGSAARVPGLAADPHHVDIGLGLDPALVGSGRGAEMGRVIMRHIGTDSPFRAVVQSWNERSLRLGRRLGFTQVGVHDVDGVAFAVLVTS